MKRNYDVAAYVWPAYTGTEKRAATFWPQGIGEWETVRDAKAKYEGHTWPRRPLWGYQDEADPDVMEMQIDAAADHGVNVFIYDWYWYDRRPFLEQCLNNGYLKARNNQRVKFYLMWANHDANNTWDKRLSDTAGDTVLWQGQIDRTEFEKVANRLIDKYFTLPNYYTIDGKPVFEIYDISNFINGLGGLDQAKDAMNWFRLRALEKGLPGLHIQATVWSDLILNISGVDSNRLTSIKDSLLALEFDSTTHYQFVHFTNVSRDYLDILPDVSKEWKRLDETYPVPYFPHISVAWDNNPRFYGLREDIMTGNTPQAIEKGLRMAKEYLDSHPGQHPLVTINSWNEWTESGYLQPDDRNGYGYLEAVKKVFGDW